MRYVFLYLLILAFPAVIMAQSVGIGTTTPNNSAALEVSSSNKGVLLTRMTTAQRKAIVSPVAGLLVYDIDKNSLYMFDGVTWLPLVATRPTLLPATERIPDSVKLGDRFGSAVAISGNFAVVGAPTDNANNNSEQGCAYIFERVNGTWIEIARINASDGFTNDHFGHAVGISGDYIAVGAPDDDSGFLLDLVSNHGTVYIFHRVNNEWVQESKIRATDYASGDNFGRALGLSNDQLVVGSPNADNNAITKTGAVYFFRRSGTSWTQINKFFRAGAQANDAFGCGVRIHSDYAIVGAEMASVGSEADAGQACIYVYGGATWTLQATLNNPSPSSTSYFGSAVDIYNDIAVISSNTYSNFGVVYAFKRTGSSWSQLPNFVSSGHVANAQFYTFGIGISLYDKYLLVGWTPIDDHRCALLKLRSDNSGWDLVRIIGFDRPTSGYSQEVYYPDFDTYDIDGENLVFGFPYLGVNGYRSGGVLFLNYAE